MALIECKEVSKSFGPKVALDHVSVDFHEGKVTGLLGPNGAGKTTLIRIINRITIPNGGEILFQGRPITQADVEKIGYMPEERGLYRKMKVGEQAMFLAQLKGMSRADALSALKDWFVRFGIQDWWNKKVEELSKGMAQKLQFITTVVHRPSLMILDEPFSGFDPVNADIVRKEILRLRDEGATIVLSTHDMGSVEELCNDIALINKSKLILSGDVQDIRRRYGNDNIELEYTDETGRHTEVLPRETDGNSTLKSFIDRGVTVNSYRELMPRMNDIFIKLVTGKEEEEQK
ncbi:MAG: ATP-binding cassette domain-containing protein [Bacteroidales bacterium]|nr:ATP-binding cassette domain-containing protein [Bacteroidales bacterium]